MMRDDMLKRKMQANRPEPAPVFSGKVTETLSNLPERKAPLISLLPISAVVLVAVAALCVFVIGNPAVGRLLTGGISPGSQQPAAAIASETATATAETPTPTPVESLPASATTAILPTPAESISPTAPETTAVPANGTPEPTPSEAQTTATPDSGTPIVTATPDAAKLTGDEFIAKFLNGGVDLREMNETHAACNGETAYGDKAYIQSIYQSPDAVIYEVIVPDDKTGNMQKYLDSHEGKEGNPKYQVLLKPEQETGLLVFVLCEGLVDDNYIGSVVSNDKFNVTLAANDDIPGKLYTKGIYAVMERCETGKFRIYVINVNPGCQQAGGCTILSRYYSNTQDGGRKLEGTYAIQVTD